MMVGELHVDPRSYRNRVRVYCDVDGVVRPEFETETGYMKADVRETIHIEELDKPYTFVSYSHIIERIRELSQRPDLDFVWLTSWRDKAPRYLDPLFGIESLGYLDFDLRMSDYSQMFKRTAIIKDQKKNPSSFVWLEDVANAPYSPYENSGLYSLFAFPPSTISKGSIAIPEDRYLSIHVDSYEGYTDQQDAIVNDWINLRVGLSGQ